MTLVIHANLSNESLALMEYLGGGGPKDGPIYIVYIHTGWAAQSWERRIQLTQEYARQKGFHWVELKDLVTFKDLALERKGFPTPKFQWCAALLKGIPLITWLDEQDPKAEWTICLPKRQALQRQPLKEWIEESEFHGDRRVWHPLWKHSNEEAEALFKATGFPSHPGRSLECEPCVHASKLDLCRMGVEDIQKTAALEKAVGQPFFAAGQFGQSYTIIESIAWAKEQVKKEGALPYNRDLFGRGCADPFGCGV